MHQGPFVYLLLLLSQFSTSLSMDADNGGGEIIRGLPCVKKLNQLFCGSSGSSYPSSAISRFINDNKALLKRMYGVEQEPKTVTVRVTKTIKYEKRFRRDLPEGTIEELLEDKDSKRNNLTATRRLKRQVGSPPHSSGERNNKEDVCESEVEVVTPYWASNSNGKVRAIVNNEEFEQAIHQEICNKPSTSRCNRDCSCEQKYKWHRLLAYDPNNDCAGIFMDWFLFPSCCVCRCSKNPFLPE